ncbi:MAG: HipA domain-containing protein [Rikenellaceae bacterium]
MSELFDVKLAAEDYSPEAQAVAMRMARTALILTSPSSLVRCKDGGVAYVSKPDATAQGIDALVAQLDGCQFDGSVEMIAEIVEDFSSISKLDVVTFFEHVIFGWVAGCSSMGLGSFALSRPNAGVCSLAAAYDFVPSALFKSSDEFALEINGKRKGITRGDFEAAMKFMGLKDRIIRITIEKMLKAESAWGDIIKNSPMCDELKERYISLISLRLKVLTQVK